MNDDDVEHGPSVPVSVGTGSSSLCLSLNCEAEASFSPHLESIQRLLLMFPPLCASQMILGHLIAIEQFVTFSGNTMDISVPGTLDETHTENKMHF